MHLQTPVPRSRLPGTNASVRLQPAKKNRLRYLKQREFKARSWLKELSRIAGKPRGAQGTDRKMSPPSDCGPMEGWSTERPWWRDWGLLPGQLPKAEGWSSGQGEGKEGWEAAMGTPLALRGIHSLNSRAPSLPEPRGLWCLPLSSLTAQSQPSAPHRTSGQACPPRDKS